MNVIEIAAAAFSALPHVERVWVDALGQFHLHPNNGGTLVERNAPKTETLIAEPKKKPKKQTKDR